MIHSSLPIQPLEQTLVGSRAYPLVKATRASLVLRSSFEKYLLAALVPVEFVAASSVPLAFAVLDVVPALAASAVLVVSV